MRHARLALVVVLCALAGIAARIAHSDHTSTALWKQAHLPNHHWRFPRQTPQLSRLRTIVRDDLWTLHHARRFHFADPIVSFHRRELRHARAKIRALTVPHGTPQEIICQVFGSYCQQALSVAACESGFSLSDDTWGGGEDHVGLFQLSDTLRADYRYTHGRYSTALDQALAGYRVFVAYGSDWSPWVCKP